MCNFDDQNTKRGPNLRDRTIKTYFSVILQTAPPPLRGGKNGMAKYAFIFNKWYN